MSRTVRNLLNIAIGQIGYIEKESCANLDSKTANAGDNNHTMYARDLRKAGYYQGDKCGYAWCDVFVDWCFYILCNKNAVIAQKITFQSGPYGAGCDFSARYYKNAGRYYTTGPKPGDQVFFGRNGSYEHTGIVESVSSTTITTIEGNTSNMVARRTYSINSSYILGYGRPDFDEDNDELFEEDKPIEIKPANPDTSHTTYKVESGDSWWKIAEVKLGSGSKMYELAMFNGATIKDILHPGNVILIPTEDDLKENIQEETVITPVIPTTPTTKPTTSNTETNIGVYKVKPGDSWWKIAEKEMGSGTKMNELAAYNGMKTTTILHPNDILKIPGKGSNNNTTTEKIYKVKPGDSWWSIAENELGSWKHMDKLAKYNGMKTTTILHPNDILKLPEV